MSYVKPAALEMFSETLKHVQPVAHAKATKKSKVTIRGGSAVKMQLKCGEGVVKVRVVYIDLVFWLAQVSKAKAHKSRKIQQNVTSKLSMAPLSVLGSGRGAKS